MSEPTYKYAPYDVLLCRIDEDCNQELHPNGQPKLFSYSSDPVNDLFNEACYEINECEERGEYRNWIQPIPMGEKPIHKQLLKIVENYISEEIKIAEETGYTDDICEGRREMAVAIQELLANARKEVADV
jgi:hypothetical protein